MKIQPRPAIHAPTTPKAADVQKTGALAARLIESAMAICGEQELAALDCLMDARRALSPLVDKPKADPANANTKMAAPEEAAALPQRALSAQRR